MDRGGYPCRRLRRSRPRPFPDVRDEAMESLARSAGPASKVADLRWSGQPASVLPWGAASRRAFVEAHALSLRVWFARGHGVRERFPGWGDCHV